MFKKYLSLILVLILTLSLFTSCGSESPAGSDKNGAAASENADGAINGSSDEDEAVIAEVEAIATDLANAVMVYDLATIKDYSVLDSEDCERILQNILTEVRTENGEYEWDGIYCGPTYDDFITVYDDYNDRNYEYLRITLTGTTLYDNTDILSEADERELLYRDEDGISAYEDAVAELQTERVAVSTFNIVFKDEAIVDSMTGETVTYEEKTVTMTIYMVLIDGQWKSYSPTIAGTFPPLGHFPRYTVEA